MSERVHQRRIFAFTFVGHALTHAYLMLFTPLLSPMGVEFRLDLEGITLYVTLVNLFFGLGAPAAGLLGDRFGEKKLLAAFFLGCAAGGLMVGLASGRLFLFAGAVVLGLSTSIYHPVGNAILSKAIRARGRALGINGIAGSLGTAIGPAFAAVVSDGLSWRWAFLILALPSLLLGIWIFVVDLGPAAVPVGKRDTFRRERPGAAWAALIALLLAAMTFGGFCFQLITVLLPRRLSESDLVPGNLSGAGIMASIALTFGAVGQFAGGALCDRLDARKLYVGALAIGAPLVLTMSYASGWLLMAAASAVSLVIFALQPIENVLIARYSREGWRGRLYGAKFILVFGVGSFGAYAAGLLAGPEGQGLPLVYQAAAACTAASFLCALLASSLRAGRAGAPRPREAAITTGSIAPP